MYMLPYILHCQYRACWCPGVSWILFYRWRPNSQSWQWSNTTSCTCCHISYTVNTVPADALVYLGFCSTDEDPIHNHDNGVTLHHVHFAIYPTLSIPCLLMPWWLKGPGGHNHDNGATLHHVHFAIYPTLSMPCLLMPWWLKGPGERLNHDNGATLHHVHVAIYPTLSLPCLMMPWCILDFVLQMKTQFTIMTME